RLVCGRLRREPGCDVAFDVLDDDDRVVNDDTDLDHEPEQRERVDRDRLRARLAQRWPILSALWREATLCRERSNLILAAGGSVCRSLASIPRCSSSTSRSHFAIGRIGTTPIYRALSNSCSG